MNQITQQTNNNTQSIIQCNNLSLGYKDHQLTKNFSFSIEKGAWLGIIGDNGSGKSTFFKTILGEINPLSGQIKLFGNKPGKIANNRQISLIPQSRHIDTPDYLTAYQLLKASVNGHKMGLPILNKDQKQKLDNLILLVGAEDYINKPFQQLSGGQKKRVFLAQALLNQPQLLLLDEPLADLDLQAKHHFIHCLQKIHQEIPLTLLMVTHEMNEIHQYLSGFIHFHRGDVILTPNYPINHTFEDHCHHV